MMHLADYLFRWTGDSAYADYYERNLYNGVLAAQHSETGMFTYFIPFKSGGHKIWSTPTMDFWCCCGTGVQAYANLPSGIYFYDEQNLWVNLFVPSSVVWKTKQGQMQWTQETNFPQDNRIRLIVRSELPLEAGLRIRIPWWAEKGSLSVNGHREKATLKPSSYHAIKRTWRKGDTVELILPQKLWLCPLPDEERKASLMYGPLVMAGITDREEVIQGSVSNMANWIKKSDEKRLLFHAHGQAGDLDFIPLFEITDQKFGIYFDWKIG